MMVVAAVTRTLLARWRLFQVLAPIGVGLGVIARRSMNPAAIGATGVVYLAAFAAFWSARRRFRQVEVRGAKRTLTLVLDGVAVDIAKVSLWTVDGGRARVYDEEGGWSLRGDDPQALEATLTRALGPPLRLQRRGSPWARAMALVVAGIGAATVVAGAAANIGPLVAIGVLSFVGGLAAFAAFLRKVVKPGAGG